MKKCKIFPISFVSEDSLRHGNDYYEGVIKENRIYYRFLDYGDEKSLLPTYQEDFWSLWVEDKETPEKFVGSFTDPKEEKELQVKDLYWTKHERIPDLFQRWWRGSTSDLQPLKNQKKAVEAFIPYESGLIRFEVDGKFGFADSETGEIKINPIWDYADDFYRGVARVVSGCCVEYVLDFYGISFKTQGGKTAYINTGNLRAVPAYTDIIRDVPESNISLEHKMIKHPSDNTRGLSDVPKSYILYEKMMIHGALELKNKIKCNYRIYSYRLELEEGKIYNNMGLHAVNTDDGMKYGEGVIYNNKVYDFNKNSKSLGLVEPQIKHGAFKRSKVDVFLDPDSDQLVQMEVNGKWGCFSLYTGRIIIEPTWDYMDDFDGTYTRVNSDSENTMHLNDKMELPLPEGKHGVIDRCNNIVISPVYDKLIFFDDQYFMVIKNGKKGLLNRQNEVIIPLIYEEMGAISINSEDLFFIVSKDKKKGVINGQNEMVIPLIYDDIKRISYKIAKSCKEHYFIVSKDKKKGLINLQNEVIIPIQWDEFFTYNEDGESDMCYRDYPFPGDDYYDSFADCIGFDIGKLIYVVGKDEAIPSFPSGNEKRFDAYSKNDAGIAPMSTRKYGIYGQDFNLIVPVELDRRPVFCRNLKVKDREDYAFHREQEHPYMILKKSGRFGFISSTGVIISEPVLLKKDAVKIIKEKWQQESDEYLRSVLKEMEEDYLGYHEEGSSNYENSDDYWMTRYTPQLIEVFEESKEPELQILASEMEMELNKSSIKRVKELFVQIQQILEAR